MRAFVASLVASALLLPLVAGAEGLDVRLDGMNAPRWQGRLALGSSPLDALPGNHADPLRSFSLMGDYYFLQRSLPGTTGGFRATSGVVSGVRPTLWAGMPGATGARGFAVDRQSLAGDVESTTAPYLGVGYTGLSLRQRWNFSADVGLYAASAGTAIKLGRSSGGSQSFDEFVRELRLSPVVQLGVSYAF